MNLDSPYKNDLHRARSREGMRKRRARAKAEKLCHDCLAPRDLPHVYCSRCYMRREKYETPERRTRHYITRRDKLRSQERCTSCGKPNESFPMWHCKACRDRSNAKKPWARYRAKTE